MQITKKAFTHVSLRGAGQGGGRGQQRQSQRIAHAEDGVRVPPLSFVLHLLLWRRGAVETAQAQEPKTREARHHTAV